MTGWLKPPQRTISAHLNHIGDYVEGHTSYRSAIDAFVQDYNSSITLRYSSPELETICYCEEAELTGRKEMLWAQIEQKISVCLNVDNTLSGAQRIITLTAGEALISVAREGEKAYFCGCKQVVLDRFLTDPDAP